MTGRERPSIRDFLAAQGRVRFLVGDLPSPEAQAEIDALVRAHRMELGLPVVGYGPPTAADANAALDWSERRAESPGAEAEA